MVIGVIHVKENANVIFDLNQLKPNNLNSNLFLACECSPQGSISMQCDKLTGACSCRKGVTGYTCSSCDRGTTGNIPYCAPCGECYDNWSETLNGIKRNNLNIIKFNNF